MAITDINRWLIESEDGAHHVDVGQVSRLKDQSWDASIEKLELADGLWLYLTSAVTHAPVTITPRADVIGRIGMHMCLDGEMSLRLPGAPKHGVMLNPSQSVIFRAIDDWAEFSLPGGQTFRHLAWSLTDEKALRLLENEVPSPLRTLFDRDARTTPMLMSAGTPGLRKKALRLFESPLSGPLYRLEAEGTVLALAAQQLFQLSNRTPEDTDDAAALSPGERKKLVLARDRLLSDMRRPPALSELSADAGMSEKRLNAGFRSLFGMTAFELLRNERLEHARQILETEDVPLKVIAHRVGYRHATNFSNAFLRRFGMPPKQYTRTRTRGQYSDGGKKRN